jgi:DNA invertase Pin-like site-specific DNA recombinase
MKGFCLYARVSKDDMHPENQFRPLLDWIKASGREQVKDPEHELGIFVDYVTSRDTRPKKEEILKLMRIGVADGVAFYNLDRWGRSMGELVLELEECLKTGRTLVSVNEGIDYSSAIGRLHAHVIASFATFERDRISERTKLSLAARKAQGMILGRPVKAGERLPCGHSTTRLRGGKCRTCAAGGTT